MVAVAASVSDCMPESDWLLSSSVKMDNIKYTTAYLCAGIEQLPLSIRSALSSCEKILTNLNTASCTQHTTTRT